ncbi:MAG: WG repeat-containing protein [Bacteroidia bacterium]|nr:WG repeat-containing protein [Bacteroidia bacterium]
MKKDDKYGFVDVTGKVLVPIIYDDALSFSEGLAIVKKEDKYGFVDINGKEVTPFIYDEPEISIMMKRIRLIQIIPAFRFSELGAWVTKDGKYGFMDVNGKLLIPIIYDDANSFSEDRAKVKKDNKYGYVDLNGNIMVPIIYDEGYDFSDGRAAVKKDNWWFFIDKNGNSIGD